MRGFQSNGPRTSTIHLTPFILKHPGVCRDAARLALSCRKLRAAHAASWWPSVDAATGAVTEPPSGRFWRTLSPGDDVQAAIDACPEGGAVLLAPGRHHLTASSARGGADSASVGRRRAGLWLDRDVCIFGRGAATLCSASGDVVIITATRAVLDGVHVRQTSERRRPDGCGVFVAAGRSRLQSCDISAARCFCVEIGGVGTDPTIANCRCVYTGRGLRCNL